MKVFFVNDTHKLGQHFGCELVMETYKEQFERTDMELVGTITKNDPIEIPDNVDLVIVNGEGSVHHGHNPHLVNIGEYYPSVFINAVWQDNPQYHLENVMNFRYVSVRESRSQKALPNAHVVPDVIFSNRRLWDYAVSNKRNGTFVSDNVLNPACGYSSTVSSAEYMFKLTAHKNAVCGRYHAAVISSVLGIPFSTWPSNTHKIEGMMEDMGIPHLHATDQASAMNIVPHELEESVIEYVCKAKKKVDNMFENLYNII